MNGVGIVAKCDSTINYIITNWSKIKVLSVSAIVVSCHFQQYFRKTMEMTVILLGGGNLNICKKNTDLLLVADKLYHI